MKKLNPEIIKSQSCCVSGDTKLVTVDGIKTFKELAEANEDVKVYCLDADGNLRVSKMFHPRLTGYNIELMKIELSDGTVLNVTPNHNILTKDGYVSAEDLYEGDKVVVLKKNVSYPDDIDEKDKQFTEYTGTKKGTVIKKCEVTGDEFECVWD
jgi:intein/homing endonuclease